jgi:hypothetical protein
MARGVHISAHFEHVLWYGDGPQLVLLRMTDKSFVLALAIDRVCENFAFFGAKVSRNQLEEYLSNRFDLRYLLSNPDRHRWFQFNLANDTSRIRLQTFEFDRQAHDSFLPEQGVFAVDHTEEYSLGAERTDYVQRYHVDGRWDVREFSRFHAQLSDLYAFLKSVNTYQDVTADLAQKRHIVESFLKPWQGGGSYLSFFKSISKQGGRSFQPELEAIKWASPGYMDIAGDKESFSDISNIIDHYDSNKISIDSEYEKLWSYLSSMKLLRMSRNNFDRKSDIATFVDTYCHEFSDSLHIVEYETLKVMAANDPLVSAKILLSVHRRVKKMHKFFLEGRITIEGLTIG